MQSRKFWFETIGLSVTMAVLFGIILALLTATAVAAFGQKDSPESVQTLSGMLTDSRCGARHPSNSGMNSAQCTLFCLKQGASWALVDGDVVYIIKGDSANFDRLAGERVTLTGRVEGNSVQVQSIEPATP